MALFRSFRYRSFAFLWSGQTISRLGDSLYRITLAWWVLEKTGSATAMGTTLIFSFIPMLLFLLLGGVAVDRLPRGWVMLVSDTMRGVVVALVAALEFVGSLEVWHIYLASILFGFADAFFEPAYAAIIPEIVPREGLPSANSLTSISKPITGTLGPMLAASIVAIGGPATAFALDGLSFFVSAGCLLMILSDLARPSMEDRVSRSALRDLRAGISTVLVTPWLWITILIFGLTNITLSGPANIALPFLVKDYLRADVGALGWLYSMLSIGSVLGAVWLGRFARIRRRGLVVYGAGIVSGLAIFAYGLPITLIGDSIAGLVNGIAIAASSLIWTNALQELIPRDMLGRVSSIDLIGSSVLLPIGYGIIGWATDQIGPQKVFVVCGISTITMFCLGLIHPAIRRLD
jgi:MFS family permease